MKFGETCFILNWVLLSFALLCFSIADLSLLRFINAELTRGYFLEHNEAKYTERRERVYTCLRIPRELEKVNVAVFFNLTCAGSDLIKQK